MSNIINGVKVPRYFNMFQMVKRRARGYRSDQHFIMTIYCI